MSGKLLRRLACDCGVEYKLIRPGDAADKAIIIYPEKSAGVIAKIIHVNAETVSRARIRAEKQKATPAFAGVASEKPEKRLGLDNKYRYATRQKSAAERPLQPFLSQRVGEETAFPESFGCSHKCSLPFPETRANRA